jgi:hypothetical protein
MDQDQKKQDPKFSKIEIIIGLFFTLLLDSISLVVDVVAMDIGWLIQIPTWLIFTLWFVLKGVKNTNTLSKRFLMPIFLQAMPDWLIPFQLSLSFILTTFFENHPEKMGKLMGFLKTAGTTAIGAATGGTGVIAAKAASGVAAKTAATTAAKASTGKIASSVQKLQKFKNVAQNFADSEPQPIEPPEEKESEMKRAA